MARILGDRPGPGGWTCGGADTAARAGRGLRAAVAGQSEDRPSDLRVPAVLAYVADGAEAAVAGSDRRAEAERSRVGRGVQGPAGQGPRHGQEPRPGSEPLQP